MIDREIVCRRLHALEPYTAELDRLAATLRRDAFGGQQLRELIAHIVRHMRSTAGSET